VSATVENLYPQVLLVASRYDLSCDYVISHLRHKKVNYLRLNSEDLSELTVELDPIRKSLKIGFEDKQYCIFSEKLRSVLFRRPVFLREYGDDQLSTSDRFSRLQWAAFVRNLMIFEEASWMNNPVSTYLSEHKALQLSIAAQIGFAVPETRITNAPHPKLIGNEPHKIAIKGLDTVLIRAEGQELFGFTNFECSSTLEPTEWKTAPATIQVELTNKLDIRVTVVGDQVFAASIMTNGQPICGDWRVQKNNAKFSEYCLPEDIAQRCCNLVKKLGLSFGGIDLALCEGQFYFLEINPTGEWAWLVDMAKLPIDKAISDYLSQNL
jgi:glutathione synthase/RimK-type ligase-like ATP-grasp enzyme